MKRILFAISAMSLLMAVSCERVEEPTQEPQMVSISFAMAGEISATDMPLSKGANDDLYAIQIDYYPKNSSTTTHYAYGLFSDLNAATLEVYSDTKYVISAYCIKGGMGDEYDFYLDIPNSYGGSSLASIKNSTITNSFSFSASQSISEHVNYRRDSYYGKVEKTISDNSVVSLEMLRCVFGLKLVAENLTKGSLSVQVGSYNFTLTPDNTSVEEPTLHFNHWAHPISSCYHVYKQDGECVANYAVKVIYTDEVGKQSVIADETMSFTRNKKKLITITLKQSSPSEVQASFSFTLDSQGMTDDTPATIVEE